ncbi:uncharacterized protein KY384_008552 [Bacidia gigantensis]|uniref:uncharacterized protein n=1 Tax=Bacidia gigantensis TaxID=2732470 RepID=UPI001D04E03B|nr:uncharacterized protein KY384_008552 [Bacidia gigantensis]KAG8527123.1 hypothetical protein KY384_008552 [Bacidia gigantensis]
MSQSRAWLTQASQGSNIERAVDVYKERYGRVPPPSFDVWYEYAKNRSTIVIDDYDSMYDDLFPFWGLSPAEIRHRTQQAISDPWNDITGIVIRDGNVSVGPNFKPTHRWMVEGFEAMMQQFVHYIPDMDLALNLNDEPRVAVPHEDMRRFLNFAERLESLSGEYKSDWSAERAKTWVGNDQLQPTRPFGSWPRMNSFDRSTSGCSPSSAARKIHTWDASAACLACAGYHSEGSFLSSWALAASPCHQPDLRNLHGFYLSPAAFKTSHELLPIFSQSKVDGFSDILYPSPWNYIDKVSYSPDSSTYQDPPFSEKSNSLFWRGATSEGVSRHGTWKGMARQRLVHLVNNLTTSHHSPALPMLLPHPRIEGKYSYQLPRDPIAQLDTTFNVSFVSIERAWDSDGAAQEAEFGLASPTDFQEHWQHRYLFDTDGAGFSGRFLPFLQSHSLPFRSGMFRTWCDSRLTAWAHFVPIDIRFHGLFSTLAYFTGTKGEKTAKTLKGRVGMESRLKQGERIAEEGREWAGKVLRKEDMEVYLFRLLLEWGRLTDDARESIGFVLEGEKG